MHIHIVAGGPFEYIPPLKREASQEDILWIGVDRGTLFLLEQGIIPAKAFGDFDSVTEEELQELKEKLPALNVFQAEKDETDLELALNWALSQHPAHIYIYGITGGRADHFLGNIHLLYKGIQHKQNITLVDKQNIIQMFEPGTYEIKEDQDKQYVSFLPFGSPVEKLTLKGFKYPLKNCHIEPGSTLCISNELIHSNGTFSFHEGILIMVRSKD
ncbi:thiamine diphosphokinase [Bacillus pumilus]|uniref:thiamine diphosphokinase n=1 Tax=Bacillus pumilus TaxID=1408 RepID=UPI00249320AD|nr:thiamine diphosphokinase [Bacillus pumilus]